MVLAGLLVTILVAPFSGYLLLTEKAHAQAAFDTEGSNPRSNFWRAVRGGSSGYSAVNGDEANVLIQNGGENWRQIRKPIAKYGGWFVLAVAIACLVFFLTKGKIKLENGESGLTVARWSAFDRFLHWSNASLFIIMAVTGLSLLYGKNILMPIIGKDVFAAFAGVAKMVHDYLGPLFIAILAILLLKWLLMNLPTGTDIKWFFKGGLFSKNHVPAGRLNGGEKLWFWLLLITGIAVSITGVVMDFPNLGALREDMQLASIIHSIAAVVLTGGAIGHIFISTAGTEGTLSAMSTGRVDVEWAKQHHDLWYEELKSNGVEPLTLAEAEEKGRRSSATGSHSAA